MNFVFNIPATPVSFIFGMKCVQSGGGTCVDATVENSDASYSDTVASGATLVLPDTTYNIYVNGVLDQSFSVPTLKNETINISA